MAEAVRDQNNVPSLLGVSSVDLTTPTRIAANPTTKALLIDSTSLYAGLDTRYQPLDSDLTTIAGLTATTDNFLVSVSSAWASRTPSQVRTTLGLVIGTDVQAYDADLTTWAGITPAAGIGTFLATPTSANLLSAVTDETGSGSLVFATSPVFTTNISTPLIIGAGAIGITPASGSNLNITLATTGDLAVNTNQLYVDTSAGFVGIGTTAPGANLEVVGSSFPTLKLDRTSSVTNAQRFSLQLTHTTSADMIDGFGAGMGFYIEDGAGVENAVAGITAIRDGADNEGSLIFQAGTSGTEDFMTIKSNGNVGIGTTAPGAKLHILGSNQNTLALDSTTNPEMTLRVSGTIKSYDAIATSAGGYFTGSILNSRIFYSVSDVFQFGGASGSYMTINGGNVGIGTTSPQAPLNTYKTPTAGFVEQIRVGGTDNYRSMDLGTWGAYDSYLSTYGNDLHILSGRGVSTENHNIKFYTGSIANGVAESNQRMIIKYDGNVGIGTTNPAYKLETLGGSTWSGTFTAAAHFIQDKTNYRGIGIGYDTASQTGVIAADTAGAASNIAFWTYNSGWGERVRIQGDGNVGIGTTGPTSLLHIQKDQNAFTIANLKNATADTGAAVRWQAVASTITTFFDTYSSGYTTAGQLRQSGAAFGTDGSGGLSILATTGDIRFAGGTADSAERMVIKNAGNVGIGTTGPDKVLEVNLGTASALRLTYNDANGSAATYMDTTVSSVGLTTFTATGSAPAFALNAKLGLKGYTVAALPTGAEGDIVYVTDQLTAAAAKGVAPTGGGAVKCVVFHNGTAWVGI